MPLSEAPVLPRVSHTHPSRLRRKAAPLCTFWLMRLQLRGPQGPMDPKAPSVFGPGQGGCGMGVEAKRTEDSGQGPTPDAVTPSPPPSGLSFPPLPHCDTNTRGRPPVRPHVPQVSHFHTSGWALTGNRLFQHSPHLTARAPAGWRVQDAVEGRRALGLHVRPALESGGLGWGQNQCPQRRSPSRRSLLTRPPCTQHPHAGPLRAETAGRGHALSRRGRWRTRGKAQAAGWSRTAHSEPHLQAPREIKASRGSLDASVQVTVVKNRPHFLRPQKRTCHRFSIISRPAHVTPRPGL